MDDTGDNQGAVVSETGEHPSIPFEQDEEKILLILTLIIGALVGLTVVAFMLLGRVST